MGRGVDLCQGCPRSGRMGQAIAMTPKALRDEFYKKNKKTFVKVDGQNIESDIWSDHEVTCVHTRFCSPSGLDNFIIDVHAAGYFKSNLNDRSKQGDILGSTKLSYICVKTLISRRLKSNLSR